MAEPVKVRRLTDEEGRKMQRLVGRGEGKGKAPVVRYRRALVVLASAGGNSVPVIARLVQTSEDRVREVIHNVNKMGMACLDPKWAGGRPRRAPVKVWTQLLTLAWLLVMRMADSAALLVKGPSRSQANRVA